MSEYNVLCSDTIATEDVSEVRMLLMSLLAPVTSMLRTLTSFHSLLVILLLVEYESTFVASLPSLHIVRTDFRDIVNFNNATFWNTTAPSRWDKRQIQCMQ